MPALHTRGCPSFTQLLGIAQKLDIEGKTTGPSHSVAKTRRPGVWQNLRGRAGPSTRVIFRQKITPFCLQRLVNLLAMLAKIQTLGFFVLINAEPN